MGVADQDVEVQHITVTDKPVGRDDSQYSSENQPTEIVSEHVSPRKPFLLREKLGQWNEKIERLSGLEKRGIARVLPEDKHQGGIRSYIQMFFLWFSINLVVNNVIIGLLGPLVFGLDWTDSVCIVVFAAAVGTVGPSYMATYGPESGNRTMVIGRFFFGYWPSKLICLLNLIQQIGWGIIGCILAGQMLSAVNGHGMTIAVGCIITAICIDLVAAFGIGLVHKYERYAFIPQLIAILTLIGCTAKDFNTANSLSVGDISAVTAGRCSYFVLQIGNIIGFSAMSADLYVYYPTKTPKWITFSTTWSGTWIALLICELVGVAIATGIASNESWSNAYSVSPGALLLECYKPVGAFGSVCVVILALGSITNNAPCSYSAALTIQAIGRYTKAVPRWIWVMFIMVIELVCSVAGSNYLFGIFENFLPIMSYWVCPWLAIVAEEHFLFYKLRGVKVDWAAWEDRRMLPIGIAAMFAFLCGWAGAVVGMAQAWWQGPLALMVGGYGGDIGTWLSIGFAGAVYPPLRYHELKKVGR